jgi:hypothetical protein
MLLLQPSKSKCIPKPNNKYRLSSSYYKQQGYCLCQLVRHSDGACLLLGLLQVDSIDLFAFGSMFLITCNTVSWSNCGFRPALADLVSKAAAGT